MAVDLSLPPVVLFFEGTSRLEVFQKIVSGLQRGGRRVQVFVGVGVRPSSLTVQETLSLQHGVG